jgi:hypothetical protein
MSPPGNIIFPILQCVMLVDQDNLARFLGSFYDVFRNRLKLRLQCLIEFLSFISSSTYLLLKIQACSAHVFKLLIIAD